MDLSFELVLIGRAMSSLEVFWWGFFGGFGAEASVVFALRHRRLKDFPHWLKSWPYYAVALVMMIIGGGIALAYGSSGITLNAILAIQIGASAPLILRKLAEAIPETPEPPDPSKIN